MRIQIDKINNGIHEVIEIRTTGAKSNDIEFLSKVTRIVDEFNTKAIEES